MSVTAVIGGQWGDEGKGKIVDLLCQDIDIVARYQGGANAGHTIQINDDTFILHQVPSGILHAGVTCVLGNGMVVDPAALTDELDTLARHNINTDGRIQISYGAHIVTPIHKAMDRATGHIIGTTGRGIGPAYSDKARRLGIRAVDMLDIGQLGDYILKRMKLSIQQGEFSEEQMNDLHREVEAFLYAAHRVAPMLADTIATLHQAMADDKNILIEGAQGVLLDVDLGTYPYVTSSHPTVGGISTGLGVPLQKIDRLVGVFKAYTTRVGSGPFPTELDDEVGQTLQNEGAEVGATTGRQRRCGWFDAVAASYACQVNGFTEVILTKLDVLDKLDTIKVCIAYEIDRQPVPGFSGAIHKLDQVTPIYEEIPGWNSVTTDLKSVKDLPLEAQGYIRRLQELIATPISQVSIGAERSQTLAL